MRRWDFHWEHASTSTTSTATTSTTTGRNGQLGRQAWPTETHGQRAKERGRRRQTRPIRWTFHLLLALRSARQGIVTRVTGAAPPLPLPPPPLPPPPPRAPPTLLLWPLLLDYPSARHCLICLIGFSRFAYAIYSLWLYRDRSHFPFSLALMEIFIGVSALFVVVVVVVVDGRFRLG